ncbi:MAG: MFS transporter, partial [Acidobacteriota bacterium]|nr:MFS transporter [Acidobacteriota bacterium]
VGGNAVRLGALFGAPVVIGALWQAGAVNVLGRRPSWAVLALALAPALLYWQLATAIDDQIALHGDRTVSGAYYAPLRAELARLAAGRPIRVEVPMTGGHWESAYLPSARPGPQISLARGWERQLDTRYAALFYGSGLGAGAYRAWLQRNAVSYVALPDARLDDAGRAEAALVRAGLPYLRELWRSAHWRLFEVLSAAPLAQAPARLEALEAQGFTLAVPRAGHFRVALRFTPYWAVLSGSACVGEAAGGYTYLSTTRPGRVRVGVRFSLARIFDHGARCT